MTTILMYYNGEEDFWGRKTLKSTNNTFQEVDGVPHYITDEGEPLYPVKDFKIIKSPDDDMK